MRRCIDVSPSAVSAVKSRAPLRYPGRTGRAAVVAVLISLVTVYAVALLRQPPQYSFWINGILYNTVFVLTALICLGRALLGPSHRIAFALLSLTAWGWVAGNAVYYLHDQYLVPIPYPSLADIGYASIYPFLIGGVLALAWPEVKDLPFGTFLDGLLGALACAAAGSVLTVRPALRDLAGAWPTQLIGAAYPVLDLTLVAGTTGVLVLKRGRVGARWVWLTAGVALEAAADTIYLHQLSNGSYQIGTPVDLLWPLAMVMLAICATCPDPVQRPARDPANSVLLPNLFILGAFVLLAYGSLPDHSLPLYALILTSLGLAAAVKRTALGVSTIRLLDASRRQAQTDELTQLSNRRHFDEQVQHALHHRAAGVPVAMMMVDLNGFKTINDTFGHHVGDEVLRQVAARMRQVIRGDDVLARLGGDEFGVLLSGCPRADALAIGERLVGEVARPMLIEGHVHSCGASVGLAVGPEDGTDLATLLQHADTAMFDAKSRRAGATSFDPAVHRETTDRLNVRDALRRHELVLHYQPQYSCLDGRMIGVEALVRWQHPTRGLLFPDSFLSFVEQAGMMGDFTVEVLEIAARARRRWSQQKVDLNLSVNLAPSALNHEGLSDVIHDILRSNSLPASALTLEITENAMMADLERSRRALADLAALGLDLSLDDYGTGYCSLTYLRDLPLDEIKIDRSFVQTLTPGSRDETIVRSTVKLASDLGLRTVAEGVETPEALRLLGDLGCDVVQGYLLSRPQPEDQVLAAATLDWPAMTGLVSR